MNMKLEDIKGIEFFKLKSEFSNYNDDVGRIMEAWSTGYITVKCKHGCMTKHIEDFEVVTEEELSKYSNVHEWDLDFEDARDFITPVLHKTIYKNLKRMSFTETQRAVKDTIKDIDDEIVLAVIEQETGEKFEFVDELTEVQKEIEEQIDIEQNISVLLTELFDNIFSIDHIGRITDLILKYSIDIVSDQDLFYDLMVGRSATYVPMVRNCSVETFDFVDKYYAEYLPKRYCDNIIYFITKYQIDLNESDLDLVDILPQ